MGFVEKGRGLNPRHVVIPKHKDKLKVLVVFSEVKKMVKAQMYAYNLNNFMRMCICTNSVGIKNYVTEQKNVLHFIPTKTTQIKRIHTFAHCCVLEP